MAARQCLKRAHLEAHRPERKVLSERAKAALGQGEEVGELARRLYDDGSGKLIGYREGSKYWLEETARLMTGDHRSPIFEATFEHGGALVRIDVLLPEGDGWRIVEVKASASVKIEHAFDCAIQRWVFENSGNKLNSIALAHVDPDFRYARDGDYKGMLKEVEQAEVTRKLLPAVPEWIEKTRVATGPGEPAIDVGGHCTEPYECPFMHYCWPSESEYPVQGLGGQRKKLGEFIAAGMTDVRDVPAARLTEEQKRIQRVTRSGQPELLPGAAAFVDSLDFPRYYLDFETIMPAIPRWHDTKPYETLPIQWSCHFEPEPGKLEHAEFLDLTGDPPMRRCAESLIRVLGKSGPILVYSGYEERVIRGLIERFADLEAPLEALLTRLIDLRKPTKQFYYHPGMAGSWSLKAVLPTIGDLDYSKLEGIQEGTQASEGYLEAIDPATTPARRAQLKQQLLRYCRYDTEGMVQLVAFLESA